MAMFDGGGGGGGGVGDGGGRRGAMWFGEGRWGVAERGVAERGGGVVEWGGRRERT